MSLMAHEQLIHNLEERIGRFSMDYMDRELAYQVLKDVTDEDFGYDGDAWRRWFEENEDEVAFKGYFRRMASSDEDEQQEG